MKQDSISRPKFRNETGTAFLSSLKKSVNDYFKDKGIKPTGNRALYIKATIFLLLLPTLYCWVIFFNPGAFVGVTLCVLLGLNLGAIGFNVMHDACHGSFSSKPWVNKLFGFSLNLMGGNADWWIEKHNIFHHTYTNIQGADEDISIPLMRAHPEQKRQWFHRYQHRYWVLMYALTYVAWIFWGDFRKYFSNKIGPHTVTKKMSRGQHWMFWISKAFYIALFIVIPLFYYSVVDFLIGYAVVLAVCGFFIAIVFQLAHVVEHVAQPVSPKDGALVEIEHEWAIHQVQTTANFGTRSRLLRFICGGLNYQIEHHLLPWVSHVHYHSIQPIVKNLCMQYNVVYNEKKTFFHAVRSHIGTLKELGRAI